MRTTKALSQKDGKLLLKQNYESEANLINLDHHLVKRSLKSYSFKKITINPNIIYIDFRGSLKTFHLYLLRKSV